MTAQLWNVLLKTGVGEPGSEPRTERCPCAALLEDLGNLPCRAAAMSAGTSLQPDLHVIVEVAKGGGGAP
jgi:hypothetical protein